MDPKNKVQSGTASTTTPKASELTFDNGPSVVGGKGNRKTGWILAIILLFLVAAGGVGFGVWTMMDSGMQVKTLNEQISTLKQQNNELQSSISDNEEILNNGIDNDLLQNLIRPYIGSFHYNSNIFDYSFDDNVRIELAFQNLRPSDILESEDELSYNVSYDTLNEEYKNLFGSSLELAQRDYAVGELGDKFYYSENHFRVVEQPGGGAGASMVSAIKDGYYDGSNIVVEVYQDVVAWCEMTEDEYCLQSLPISNSSDSLELIAEHGDNVPVYKMTFALDNGHYVLISVEKE